MADPVAPFRPSYPKPDARVWAMRAAFRAVGVVAPGVAARWAEELFCRPPRQEARPREESFLGTGRRFTVTSGPHSLAVWEWGSGPPVVLVHGWGSRSGRFSVIAPALVEAGRRVIVFDAPAHGASTGYRASLVEFAQALRSVADAVGPVDGLVGHSLGGAAIAVALARGLRGSRAVLIAPPADPAGFSHRFAQFLAIPPRAREAMQRNLETRFDTPWTDLHIPTLAARMRLPLLVLHDADDPDVAWTDGDAIARAWPGAELVTTSGLGHRAIVRDAGVVRRVVEFLTRAG
jgi:pimeloyl-ACP methyl ester carboxylesterase